VDACGPCSLSLFDNLAVLSDPESCGSEEHCIEPCPENAIHMAWLPWAGNEARGVWQTSTLLAQT
jgi:Na+-translocating ferredoxin:NAD+ oxidoreductase RNF subunit RnfB